MRGLILPLLVLAGTFWVGLPGQHPASLPLNTPVEPSPNMTDLAPTTLPQGNLDWLESLLGQLPPKPALTGILLPVDDLGSLADDSPVHLATLAELRRWQGNGPWTVDKIQILVGPPDDEGAIPLTAKFEGVASAVIPILEHLLASPFRQGYLVDPSHLRMTQGEAEILHVIFRVRVLAAEQFLSGSLQ